MRQHYEKNKASFMTPLTVTLREMMVAVPTRTENGKEVFSRPTMRRPRKRLKESEPA